MAPPPDKLLSVAIGGIGAIGFPVARRLAQGLPGFRLAAVAARDPARAERTAPRDRPKAGNTPGTLAYRHRGVAQLVERRSPKP